MRSQTWRIAIVVFQTAVIFSEMHLTKRESLDLTYTITRLLETLIHLVYILLSEYSLKTSFAGGLLLSATFFAMPSSDP